MPRSLLPLALGLALLGLAQAPRAQTQRVDTTRTDRTASVAHSTSAPPPYPVLFVHGLDSSDLTWETTIEHLEADGWGEPYSYHADLNASTSTRYDLDFVWADPVSYWEFADRSPGADSTLDLSDRARPAGGANSHLFVANFEAYFDAVDNLLYVHSDRGLSDHSESNCSAIAKQGYALSAIIGDILDWTGSDRVILMGHSMGGLAIREYLQRRNPDGTHTWWVEPGDATGGHHVAAAVTTGTPHQGSNTWDFGVVGCPDSEALRDLRYSFISTGETAPYLYGGTETIQAYWHNDDVNADGDVSDTIRGINSGTPSSVLSRDNPILPLPRDVGYYYVFSNWFAGGDGIVDTDRQYIVETGPDGNLYYAPYGAAVGRRVDVFHTSQPDDYETIEQALLYYSFPTDEAAAAPTTPALAVSAYPNPTTGPLSVSVRLDRPARVGVALVDVLGRTVLVASDAPAAAGAHVVSLDASALSAGVYLLVATVDGVPQPGQRVTVGR